MQLAGESVVRKHRKARRTTYFTKAATRSGAATVSAGPALGVVTSRSRRRKLPVAIPNLATSHAGWPRTFMGDTGLEHQPGTGLRRGPGCHAGCGSLRCSEICSGCYLACYHGGSGG
jgi:hypothetical protein